LFILVDFPAPGSGIGNVDAVKMMVPHGEECAYPKLADTTGGMKFKATVMGLCIPHVMSESQLSQGGHSDEI
jgi:hypothetical protein